MIVIMWRIVLREREESKEEPLVMMMVEESKPNLILYKEFNEFTLISDLVYIIYNTGKYNKLY